MTPDCSNCKHDKPYDQSLTGIRMCLALGVQHRKSRDFMRQFGECGEEGALWEARAGT